MLLIGAKEIRKRKINFWLDPTTIAGVIVLGVIASIISAILLYGWDRVVRFFGFSKNQDIEDLREDIHKEMDELRDIIESRIPPQINPNPLATLLRKENQEITLTDNEKPAFRINSSVATEAITITAATDSLPILKYLRPEARSGLISFVLEKGAKDLKKGKLEDFIKKQVTNGNENSQDETKWLYIFKELDFVDYMRGILNPLLSELEDNKISNITDEFTTFCEGLNKRKGAKGFEKYLFKINNYKIAVVRIGAPKKVAHYNDMTGKPYQKLIDTLEKGYDSIFISSRGAHNKIAESIGALMVKNPKFSSTPYINTDGQIQIIHIRRKKASESQNMVKKTKENERQEAIA